MSDVTSPSGAVPVPPPSRLRSRRVLSPYLCHTYCALFSNASNRSSTDASCARSSRAPRRTKGTASAEGAAATVWGAAGVVAMGEAVVVEVVQQHTNMAATAATRRRICLATRARVLC